MSNSSKKRITYYKLYGKHMVLDEIYTTESRMLRNYYRGGYGRVIPTKIESSILEKALDFCKQRAEIKNKYYAPHLLQEKLNDFDSDIRTKYQNHDDAIGLVYAAARLDITRLYEILFEDVVQMIDRKTPQEINDIFPIFYDGDDARLDTMMYIMELADQRRPLKSIM